MKTIGLMLVEKKIVTYQKGVDLTKKVGNDEIQKRTIEFTYDEVKLQEVKFQIIWCSNTN